MVAQETHQLPLRLKETTAEETRNQTQVEAAVAEHRLVVELHLQATEPQVAQDHHLLFLALQ